MKVSSLGFKKVSKAKHRVLGGTIFFLLTLWEDWGLLHYYVSDGLEPPCKFDGGGGTCGVLETSSASYLCGHFWVPIGSIKKEPSADESDNYYLKQPPKTHKTIKSCNQDIHEWDALILHEFWMTRGAQQQWTKTDQNVLSHCRTPSCWDMDFPLISKNSFPFHCGDI